MPSESEPTESDLPESAEPDAPDDWEDSDESDLEGVEEPEDLPKRQSMDRSDLGGGVTTTFGPSPQSTGPDSSLILPPFFHTRVGRVETTGLFPLYFQRRAPDDFQLLAGPYYRRRGAELNVDVAFPVYWSFRTVDATTTVVPPFYLHQGSEGFDVGLAPLFFVGDQDESAYTVIPPLLTAAWANKRRARTFVGPFWRFRNDRSVNWGLFPLLWNSRDDVGSHTIFAPFYFNFENDEDETSLTVVPPVYHRETKEQATWGLAPALHHYHDADGTSWTVPPLLFHYSKFGSDLRLVTPLFGYFGVGGDHTLITPVYQRHRGDTELDAVAPFFFSWRDPRQHSNALVIPPLVWHFGNPASETTLALPFFGRFHERGHHTTWITPLVGHYENHRESAAGTWIFPTFQFSHTPTSNTFNLHPLVYATEARDHRHLVIAPIFWDFEDYTDRSRTTIAFPLFWRFQNGPNVSQLAGNTYYHAWRSRGVSGWEFHFFPLFAFGVPRPGDHWWNVLYGLVGYRRQGRYAKASTFWIPFEVDGPE